MGRVCYGEGGCYFCDHVGGNSVSLMDRGLFVCGGCLYRLVFERKLTRYVFGLGVVVLVFFVVFVLVRLF